MAFGVPVLEDLPPVEGRSVLVRCDFNVPLRDGVIADDHRIRAALPTLEWLTSRGANVTAVTHLGRPKGAPDPAYDVAPVRKRLAELAPGVALGENLRFSPGETANDPDFVDELVAGHDLYVNDAFGASHRAHASIVGPPSRLPSAAGRLLEREVEVLLGLAAGPAGRSWRSPAAPRCPTSSGSSGPCWASPMRSSSAEACFTFFAALGHPVGSSLLEPDRIDDCRALLEEFGDRLVLPSDVVALGPGGRLGDPSAGGEVRNTGRSLAEEWMGLDIGPGSAAEFGDRIAEASTVLWNGPMGVFEDPRFEAGTRSVAQAVADCRGFTVIGGGDSAAAIAQFDLEDQVDHISTGGGASLELIERGDLPGLEALRRAPNAGEDDANNR
ncbi:MAG: phosphoglycerate kinase [Microthrixaceae bacterium]